MIKWIVCFICLGASSCHPKDLSSVLLLSEVSTIKDEAVNRFDDKYKIINNSNERFSLVRNKTKKFSEIGFDVNYFVFDNELNLVIHEGFLKSGSVDWIDENQIKSVSREINENRQRNKVVYIFNVLTKEKIFQ